MSRIHLRSNTLVLWLSLSAAVAASALGVACSSSSDSEATGGDSGAGAAGKSGGKSGSANSGGDSATGGGDTGDGEGGVIDMPSAGKGGATGTGGGAPNGGGDTSDAGSGGAPDVMEDPDAAAKARAVALINALPVDEKCTTCHQKSYSGLGFWANITQDEEFGIGTWDKDDIKRAIAEGKDKDGQTLCATMKRYTEFTPTQLDDLATYLKSIAAVHKEITMVCDE